MKCAVELLSARLSEQSVAMDNLCAVWSLTRDEVRELRVVFMPKFVRNTATGGVHAVRQHMRLLPPSLWKANCCWRFGDKLEVEWLQHAPLKKAEKCFRCFGE